jgi:hypothetical protein
MAERPHSNESTQDLVGIAEIAERLGVALRTVSMWRYRHHRTHGRRGSRSPTRTHLGGHPCWQWKDVEAWANATGRL